MWHSWSKSPTWPILVSKIQAKTWNRLQKSKKMFVHIPLGKRTFLQIQSVLMGPDEWKHLEPLATAKTWENDDCNKRSHLGASVTEVEYTLKQLVWKHY